MARQSAFDAWVARGNDPDGTACPGCREQVDEAALIWTDDARGWRTATHDCGRVLWLYDGEVSA